MPAHSSQPRVSSLSYPLNPFVRPSGTLRNTVDLGGHHLTSGLVSRSNLNRRYSEDSVWFANCYAEAGGLVEVIYGSAKINYCFRRGGHSRRRYHVSILPGFERESAAAQSDPDCRRGN